MIHSLTGLQNARFAGKMSCILVWFFSSSAQQDIMEEIEVWIQSWDFARFGVRSTRSWVGIEGINGETKKFKRTASDVCSWEGHAECSRVHKASSVLQKRSIELVQDTLFFHSSCHTSLVGSAAFLWSSLREAEWSVGFSKIRLCDFQTFSGTVKLLLYN